MNKSLLVSSIIVLSLVLSAATVDLSNLFNYANQAKPNYITKDNTTTNAINDKEATLGRVLFYDKNLSVDNSTACASCHLQQFAFGDTARASVGINGTTGRHSMRLINTRFAEETHFFWDERANTLEDQVIQPIQDHTEMGFSGVGTDPDFDSLKRKITSLTHYNTLFDFAYNDTIVTNLRIQNALAQFVRSIQSFDSKYDVGLAQVNNPNQPFPNFTQQENNGKMLFSAPPQFDPNGMRTGGGAGCQGCHQGPEFDIDSASRNNGVIGSIGSTSPDFTNTRAPSLRDVFNPNGSLNGPLMHTGSFTNMFSVINHYNSIPNQTGNNNLDNRLRPGGNPQQLQLTNPEISSLIFFLQTLSGTDVYTNPKWSNPFTNDSIIISTTTAIALHKKESTFSLYPNPAQSKLFIKGIGTNVTQPDFQIFSLTGKLMMSEKYKNAIDISNLSRGVYILRIDGATQQFIKK